MSWSIRFVGRPAKIIEALQAYSEKLAGESKREFEAARPLMVGALQQNFTDQGEPSPMRLTASGHGGSKDGKPAYNSLAIGLEYVSDTLV